MPWFWLSLVFVVLAALYGLHRAALWAEARGWIYYTTKGRPGMGFSLIGQIYQPSIEHVVEEEQSTRLKADQDDSGDTSDPESSLGTGSLDH
jgi:hypothetical protein